MSGGPRSNWPRGVQQISVDDLKRLGIDADRQIYWDGERIEIRRPLVLSDGQKLVAAIVTGVAILGGLGGFVSGINNFSIFLCARNQHWLTCPVAPLAASRRSVGRSMPGPTGDVR